MNNKVKRGGLRLSLCERSFYSDGMLCAFKAALVTCEEDLLGDTLLRVGKNGRKIIRIIIHTGSCPQPIELKVKQRSRVLC